MLKCKKKILSVVLSFVLVVTLIVSIGSVTAFAALSDCDVQGVRINSMIDAFIAKWRFEWEFDRQCPENQGTIVFIDAQLLEFNFLERLCNSFDMSYDVEGLQYIYALTGMYFLVHNGNNVYVDVTEFALNAGQTNYVYDFEDPLTRDDLSSVVGYRSMCALAIWHFEPYMYDFFMSLQMEWYDDFPIYVIERDPIPPTSNGLNLKIYNSITGEFGSHSNSGGGIG